MKEEKERRMYAQKSEVLKDRKTFQMIMSFAFSYYRSTDFFYSVRCLNGQDIQMM